jgi:hypothetical protein
MTVTIDGTNGVTTPDVEVSSGGSASTPAITVSGDTNTGIFFPAADTIAFAEGGAEAMRIDSSGNVGIGTTSPNVGAAGPGNAILTLTGTDAARSGIIEMQAPSQLFDNTATGLFRFFNGTNEISRIESRTQGDVNDAGRLQFYTRATSGSLTERMRITSGGSLLVANTNMLIDNSGNTATGVGIGTDGRTHIATGSGLTNLLIQKLSSSGSQNLLFFLYGSTAVGSITSSGSTTAYNTSSDYRLKHDIQPMTGALAKVLELNPVTYTWKVDGSAGEGFVAHELQAVCPDAVTGEKDAVETYTDEDGVEQTRPVYQGVDTSFLVATLTAAIQELKAINDAQAIRIETLEAKVAALEAR